MMFCDKQLVFRKRLFFRNVMTVTPIETADPTNACILAVSEDKIKGFLPDPLTEIAQLSGVSR
jgi:hypothetical protein